MIMQDLGKPIALMNDTEINNLWIDMNKDGTELQRLDLVNLKWVKMYKYCDIDALRCRKLSIFRVVKDMR